MDRAANTGAGLQIAKVKRNAKNVSAKLTVSVPGPGKLVLNGKGLKRVPASAGQARMGLLATPEGRAEAQARGEWEGQGQGKGQLLRGPQQRREDEDQDAEAAQALSP